LPTSTTLNSCASGDVLVSRARCIPPVFIDEAHRQLAARGHLVGGVVEALRHLVGVRLGAVDAALALGGDERRVGHLPA